MTTLLLGLAPVAPLRAQEPGANLQVYLMTMGAGADVEERFGHNAIWIRDSIARTDLIYNFGTYQFPGTFAGLVGFGVQFAMGPPRYWLGVDSSLDNQLRFYRWRQRDLTAQLLNLTPTQRADLASRLAVNAREENRYYRYDYFRDNCSTRVRDILDAELGGALKTATTGKPSEGTYRWHTRRSIANNIALFTTIDAAFAHNADRPMDQWDEMFLPAKVQERVRELKVPGANGQSEPLVTKEFSLLTIGAYHVEIAPPNWTLPFLLVGIAVSGLIRLARSSRGIAIVGRVVAGSWMLLMGIGGVILLFFWILTKHWATHGNWNLLLMSPLALALVPAFWRRARSAPRSWIPRVAIFVMASVAIGAVLAMMPQLSGQDNKLIAALVALPTFCGALEALAAGNEGASRQVRGPT